jgi:predicted RNA-binding Zn-ribbon protein involved in translation (DUF1610 family)
MGMFDSVLFECPECGNTIEEQSKAGNCHLDRFDQSGVPINIAVSIEGDMVYCAECSNSFIIKAPIPTTVSLILTKF